MEAEPLGGVMALCGRCGKAWTYDHTDRAAVRTMERELAAHAKAEREAWWRRWGDDPTPDDTGLATTNTGG